MQSEAQILAAIEYHKKAALLNGTSPSTYNYHVGAITALKAVLEVA